MNSQKDPPGGQQVTFCGEPLTAAEHKAVALLLDVLRTTNNDAGRAIVCTIATYRASKRWKVPRRPFIDLEGVAEILAELAPRQPGKLVLMPRDRG